MKPTRLAGWLAGGLIAGLAASAHAQQTSADAMLSIMHERVQAVADAYAAKIGVTDYVPYCQTELRFFEKQLIAGKIPFDVDPDPIEGSKEASDLRAREAYERASLILCLADAKNKLTQAEHK